jgi:hypothetical protein
MRTKYWLVKLAVVVLCGAAVLAPGDISSGADDFYVIPVSQWKRNGANLYYQDGNVGIGTDITDSKLNIVDDTQMGGLYVSSNAGDGCTIYSVTTADYASAAVSGRAWSPTGSTVGVDGYSNSSDAVACGVIGSIVTGGAGTGVKGIAESATGYGVYGKNVATTGDAIGVKASTASAGGYGVYGENTGGGGSGVFGAALPNGSPGNGVYGWAYGSGAGVRGYNASAGGYGVYGINGAGGYAVFAEGKMGCTGAKPAIVPTSRGHRELYSQESPELWFEDFGEGQLVGGKARIDLDPLFLETVTINDQQPMKVFIQLNDDCHGVYVRRQAAGFEVKELQAGTSGARFTYRVVAKRKGYETARLEAAPDPVKVAALRAPEK